MAKHPFELIECTSTDTWDSNALVLERTPEGAWRASLREPTPGVTGASRTGAIMSLVRELNALAYWLQAHAAESCPRHCRDCGALLPGHFRDCKTAP